MMRPGLFREFFLPLPYRLTRWMTQKTTRLVICKTARVMSGRAPWCLPAGLRPIAAATSSIV